MESAALYLKPTLYALLAWGASILIAAIPTNNSKIAHRIQWLAVRGTMIVGIPFALYGFVSIPKYTSQTWGWPWYLSFPVTMLHIGLMCTIQWYVMKHSGNIWFDDKPPQASRDTQKSLFSRSLFVKKEYLAGVLLLSGLLVGFFAGREFPRETLLEKECRVLAENSSGLHLHIEEEAADPLAKYEVGPSLHARRLMFAATFTQCMRGGR